MTDHHIGMIVPSSNLTMETELPRMLRAREETRPEDRFVFHAARARMQHVTPEQLRAMNAQAERAAAELADARPDVVATACLVAIMAQGPGYHCTAEDSISAALRAEGSDAPVISSAGALLSGLAALVIEWDDGPHANLDTRQIVAELEKATLKSGAVAQNIGDGGGSPHEDNVYAHEAAR